MIVLMNEGAAERVRAEWLASMYDEKLVTSSEFNETIFQNEDRITFYGHADSEKYGEALFSEKEFADKLIKSGLNPNKHVTIDLIGCKLAYAGAGMDEKSYAHKVYEELKSRGYNITVNALINFNSKEPVTEMMVMSSPTQIRSWGTRQRAGEILSPENKVDLFEKIRERENLKLQKKSIISNKQLKELNRQLEKNKNTIVKLSPKITDIRAAFDNNPKYQINTNTFNDLNLPPASRLAIIAISDRLAELKNEMSEIGGATLSALFYWARGGEIKENKIRLLESLITDIRSNPENINKFIFDAMENPDLFTARTKVALENISEDLQALAEDKKIKSTISYEYTGYDRKNKLIFDFQSNDELQAAKDMLDGLDLPFIMKTGETAITIDPIVEWIDVGKSNEIYAVLNFPNQQALNTFTTIMSMTNQADGSLIIAEQENSIYLNITAYRNNTNQMKEYFDDDWTFDDDENAEILRKIQIKMQSARIAGELENGEWKNDPDNKYRHKYEVLTATRDYLLDEIEINQLSMVVDRCTQYNSNFLEFFNVDSGTKDLLNNALDIRKEQLIELIQPSRFENVEITPKSVVDLSNSGYVYVDRMPSAFVHDNYQRERQNALLKIYHDIQKEILSMQADDNRDESVRHKYEMLNATKRYLFGNIDLDELSIVADRCKHYKKSMLFTSEAELLVNRALKLRDNVNDVKQVYKGELLEKDTVSPFAKEKLMMKANKFDPEKMGFHLHTVEAGSSGYIYIDGKFTNKINELYDTNEKAKKCEEYCTQIKEQMDSIAVKGKFKNNEWKKDPDNRYRHKYEMLSMTMGYLLGEVDLQQLALAGDRCAKYDAQWAGSLGRSDTGKLLDKVLVIRGETDKLPAIKHEQIKEIFPSAKKNIHGFFDSDTVVKNKIENVKLEVGHSGYMYIDKNIYPEIDNAKECVEICKDIQSKLKSLHKEGKYEYNKWKKDPGNEHRHQYNVLSATMKYLLGEISKDKLEDTISKSPQYDKWATRRLVERAETLKNVKFSKHAMIRNV